jgi:glutamate N-acetyltransferase / amino-acid N-acetyltransferase
VLEPHWREAMSMHIPRGFKFGGVHAGIKSNPQKEDVALVVCPAGAVAAGMYTQNLVYAAPVALDRARTPSDDMRVVVVNSGNANACTGERGLRDAEQMAQLAAEACGYAADQALVMSTGIIGRFLPMEKIAAGTKACAARLDATEAAFMAAARGICTTDKSTKTASCEIKLPSGIYRVAGMCKGAGMIGPNMATLLGVLTTDARLTAAAAQSLLKRVVEASFNCISVEGHMSTNDTVLLLASGAASEQCLSDNELVAFEQAFTQLAIELATQIPDDGEGATHLIEIEVQGTRTREEARCIAQTIADSALVKTAIAGGDPNWGRIVSAAGYAGVKFDPHKVNLAINRHEIYRAGTPLPFDARTVSQSIKSQRNTHLLLTLGEGSGSVRFWTSDLTVEYVKFNADYST